MGKINIGPSRDSVNNSSHVFEKFSTYENVSTLVLDSSTDVTITAEEALEIPQSPALSEVIEHHYHNVSTLDSKAREHSRLVNRKLERSKEEMLKELSELKKITTLRNGANKVDFEVLADRANKLERENIELRARLHHIDNQIADLSATPITEIVREKTEYRLHGGFILFGMILILMNAILLLK